MARTRNIKPGFFTNDRLAEIDPLGRLLFAGLWTIADRAGRLEDRPKRIKAAVLPYDDCDIDGLLDALAVGGFICRYAVDESAFIQIATWDKHQNPHPREMASTIPGVGEPVPSNGNAIADNGKSTTKHDPGNDNDAPRNDPGNAFDVPSNAHVLTLSHSSSLHSSSLNLGESGETPPAADAAPTPKVHSFPKPRAYTIPDNFEPSELLLEKAVGYGMTANEARRETEVFRDHYQATGGKMVDWDAAWRKWMQKSLTMRPKDRTSPNGRASPEPTDFPADGGLAAFRAKGRREEP